MTIAQSQARAVGGGVGEPGAGDGTLGAVGKREGLSCEHAAKVKVARTVSASFIALLAARADEEGAMRAAREETEGRRPRLEAWKKRTQEWLKANPGWRP
jgi:hypothetical protein